MTVTYVLQFAHYNITFIYRKCLQMICDF